MKITLRPWRLTDSGAIAAAINNKKIQDNLRDGIPYPYSEADGEDFIKATLSARPNSQYAFAICCDDRVVGSIGVFRQENIHRLSGEVGYFIAEDYWGRGIMTEALKQICDFIFENTDIIRIYAEPFDFNIASCKALEKAGFQFEGILRQNAVKNGHTTDMKMYSKIKNSGVVKC